MDGSFQAAIGLHYSPVRSKKNMPLNYSQPTLGLVSDTDVEQPVR